MHVAVIGVLVLTVAPVFSAETLPLGPGTACVLVPEHEAKAMLGVKKRHLLACADSTGKVIRVVLTRRGKLDCIDGVQVARGFGYCTDGQLYGSVTPDGQHLGGTV